MEDSKNPDFIEQFFLNCGFATRALHAGEHVGQPHTPAHTTPIYQSSTFIFQSSDHGAAIFKGETPGYVYTRMGNPTVMALEAKINALEGGRWKLDHPDDVIATLAFSSGMAAIAAALMACASAGDTILMGDVVYGATEHLCSAVLSRYNVKTVEVHMSDLDAVRDALKANPRAKLIFFETPVNPTLELVDIPAVVKLVREINPDMRVIVDNTFATPYLQRPLELGADVVVHSTTKYIGGHGAVVGGLATTRHVSVKDELYKVIKDIGSSPSPFDTWLVNMGLKTLPIRMDKHCSNAMAVARFLEEHPKVAKVYYPGLVSHPQHELAKRQMGNFGGMLSFELQGGFEAGKKLMDTIEIFSLAVSLGCVDSLIQHPASMTHASVPADKKKKGGITDGLVRISVGIEDPEDLIRSLDEALAKI